MQSLEAACEEGEVSSNNVLENVKHGKIIPIY